METGRKKGKEKYAYFDESGSQTTVNVPFDVAMEEPDSGIVGAKSDDDVSVRTHYPRISLHWDGW